MKITNVEAIPIAPRLAQRYADRAVDLYGIDCRVVVKVETDAGITGWGETIQNYTWGRVRAHERVMGQSPFATMWDDFLGAGLQMALFDAAGKLAGVSLY